MVVAQDWKCPDGSVLVLESPAHSRTLALLGCLVVEVVEQLWADLHPLLVQIGLHC